MAIWPFRRRAPAPEAPPAAAARLDRVPDPDLDAPEARVPRLRTDGFVDTLAGHGTDRDPRLGMYFLPDLLTEEQEIQIVRGSWLGKRIVGDIVDEAFRPGWELEIGEHAQARAANGDVAGVDEQYAEERKRNVRAAWKRLGVMKALRTALKWERAHGGAAIMLGLDDKQTKPDQKARDTAKLRWLRVIRARDLYPARYYTDPFADKYGEVELWQIVPSSRNGVSGPSPQLFIHESRLIVFGGERVTDTVEQGQLPGFGDGVLMLVVAALRRFASAIDALKGLRKGRLRVALVTTAKYFLPRMLGAFCQRYPDIEIELEVANRARIIERLRANEDDLYIMSFPPEELDVVATPFLDNPLVVVAPAAYPLPAGPLSLADLAPHPFLLRETGSGTRKAVDRHLAANGLTLKVKLALGSNEAIRDLVASGMGLAILSRHVLGEHPEQEGLRILEVAGFPLQQPWSVVHLRQKILSLPAHAFMNELLPAVRMAADTP